MSRSLFEAIPRALDANGDGVSGAKLYIYTAGTTTAATAYSDLGMTTPHAHPIVADSAGVFAAIYLPDGDYKYRLTDASDVVLQEADNVTQATAGANLTRYNLDTVADLVADTRLAYSAGAAKHLVAAGDLVDAGGFRFEVAVSGASDHHVTTAGGVKLYESGLVYTALARFKADVARGTTFEAGTTVTAAGEVYNFLDDGNTDITDLTGWNLAAKSDTESRLDAAETGLASNDTELADHETRIAGVEALGVQGFEMTSGGPVACATTANITLSGEQTIDGVTTSADRILVKDQAAPEENGIYVTDAGAWSRASDMNAAADVEGTGVYVSGGTASGGKTFITYSAVTTLGTDAIAFAEGADASGVQTQVDASLDDFSEFGAKYERYVRELAAEGEDNPLALVMILLGQSLNESRSTNAVTKGAPVAKMLVGGAAMADWLHDAVNAEHSAHWDDLASVVDFTEGSGQSPCVGVVDAVAGGNFAQVYIASVAIGSRKMEKLIDQGPFANLHAAVSRLCALARADGYNPRVAFYSAHGEADSAASTTETGYYDLAMDYYGRAQLLAAQAMRKPGYVAPVVLTRPTSGSRPSETMEEIHEAIRRIGQDLPGAMDLGAIYQWDVESDRIHPTPGAYVQRGEAVGRLIRDHFEQGVTWRGLHIVDATWDGATTAVVTFSDAIVKDTSQGVGESLNSANAVDGFEWFDNGTNIAISTVTYSGRRATITLASAPSGTTAQQVVRIASQEVTSTLISGAANRSGSQVRAAGDGWPSIYDGSYTNYQWATPQRFEDVRDA